MPVFEGNSKSLSSLYVFYSRLTGPGSPYPMLGQYVKNASQRILGQTGNYSLDASGIRKQAQAEFAKEKAMLEKIFGVSLNFDYYGRAADGSRTGFKEVMDALNACLNLKEVYQRNVQLITNTKMKSVISWYPTYFMHAWEARWPAIEGAAKGAFNGDANELARVLAQILDNEIPQICVDGIRRMLDGPEVEHNLVDPNLKNAYKSLVSQIGDVQTAGSLANEIYKIYQLDKLRDGILENLEVNGGKILSEKIQSKAKSMVSHNIYVRGGFTLEAIENVIFAAVAAAFNGSAIHSGDKGVKADNILTLSVDPSFVDRALQEADGTREKNIAAFSKLGQQLSNLNEGFIVYSSDKNYTLNANFGGFGAGSVGVNAAAFLNSLPGADKSTATLIGALQQLGAGAMLKGQQGVFEKLIAQDIAYMLFDDFTTIGVETSGGQAIHVMNLNGIMAPTSIFLTMLADAIESASAEEIGKLVKVSISAPPILFSTDEEQYRAFPNDSMGAWNYQRDYTLANTKITTKFWKDFRSFIMSLI